jgi:hypothetical protein
MGWKVSTLIINTSAEGANFEAILNSIGYNNLEKIDDVPFDSAIYPNSNDIYIAIYKGNLIITAQDLPLYFIDQEPNEIEKRVIKSFPEAEICALSLNSTVNHFAFSIIENGKKVRVKVADMNAGTVIDFGLPLEEELDLLARSRITSEGQRNKILALAENLTGKIR